MLDFCLAVTPFKQKLTEETGSPNWNPATSGEDAGQVQNHLI